MLLPLLLTHLRSNLSHTISAKEGEAAVELLAEELAPEWLEIAGMGSVRGVVIKRLGAVPEMEMKARIERARSKAVAVGG